tara:strand:+ start:101 stop:322 length:222 start_codon:yes stop_codon:yes gene_type:complete
MPSSVVEEVVLHMVVVLDMKLVEVVQVPSLGKESLVQNQFQYSLILLLLVVVVLVDHMAMQTIARETIVLFMV